MVVQNNPTPWIFLALVVMGGCALTGMLLGGVGPLSNPQWKLSNPSGREARRKLPWSKQ